MDTLSRARLNNICSMFIYGTIGIFVRHIPLPSSVTAMARALIGAPFLLLLMLLRGKRISLPALRRNAAFLTVSGFLLGFNWILLFEAYRYTSVATATLCYYLSPIILVAASPLLFKERMTARKLLCILAALIGMVLVSGAVGAGLPSAGELRGIALGLGAAVLYACIVVCNKKLRDISAFDRTSVQLGISALVMLLYNLLTGSLSGLSLTPAALALLAVVGVVHTGVAYYLYFGSMEHLSSQTLAILSYIDPVIAVLLSALLLRESLGIPDIAGAALILGAALISELPEKKAYSAPPSGK